MKQRIISALIALIICIPIILNEIRKYLILTHSKELMKQVLEN